MLSTQVWEKGPAQFNMVGQKLPTQLHLTAEHISAGLALRLHRYAQRELFEQGFGALAKDANVSVYSIDAEDRPADRSYCVRWHTPQGGYVELVGILTKSGWPSLNHGFDIGFEALET